MWPRSRQSPEGEPDPSSNAHCGNGAVCHNTNVYRATRTVKPAACLALQVAINPVGMLPDTELSCRELTGGCDSLVTHSRDPESASPNLPVLSRPELCPYGSEFIERES